MTGAYRSGRSPHWTKVKNRKYPAMERVMEVVSVRPDGGGKDVFVHISAVEKAGYTSLADGAKVSFDVVPNRGKESAENLKIR